MNQCILIFFLVINNSSAKPAALRDINEDLKKWKINEIKKKNNKCFRIYILTLSDDDDRIKKHFA